MILALLLSTAWADEDGLTDDEFSFLEEGDVAAEARQADVVSGDTFSLYSDEEEDFGDFALKAEEPVPAPVVVKAPASKPALTGNFEAQIVSVEQDSVVVELPVALGTKADFTSDYWLVGEVFVDGAKVGETRQLVTSANLSGSGSVAYLKLQAPVKAGKGSVEVRVSKLEGSKSTALFSRSTSYTL